MAKTTFFGYYNGYYGNTGVIPCLGSHKDIQKLLEEKAPLIMARANPTIAGAPTAHEMQLQLTAKQSVDSMTSALKLLLARIQKFTSHTFHVFIRDLVPGAKAGRSLLFTRIVEHRNQYIRYNGYDPDV